MSDQNKQQEQPQNVYPYNYLPNMPGYGYQYPANNYAAYNNYQQVGYWSHYQHAQYYQQQLQNQQQQQPMNFPPPTLPQSPQNANQRRHNNFNPNLKRHSAMR